MTDKQLYAFMQGMIGELGAAMDAVRDIMPEDAPRHEYSDFFGRVTDTDFEAMVPLNKLWTSWTNRANELIEPVKTP